VPLDSVPIHGFAPVAGPDARVLVLGTMPSERSLAAGEYYAHPQNAFWPIVEELFAGHRVRDYAARAAMLVAVKVALWDVLASTVRPGSLDSSIVRATEVPNDIAGFLVAHPEVSVVFFNGAKARELFGRHMATALPADRAVRLVVLPSTSPANAAASREAKLEAWRELARAVGEGPDRDGCLTARS
jgi:TDG/mug DNA glycosylase family protein